MSSKSNCTVILYAGFAAIVTLLFLTGQLGSFIAGAGIPAYRADLAAFLVILGAGLGAWVGGGSKQGILIVGTIGAFIVLTAHQELAMVRYMSLAGILFAIGIYGLTVSRNAVRMLMSIELMINAANINFVTFARYVDPSELRGQLFAIFVLTVAAAEAAVGLAIVLAIYRNMATVDMERFNLLKW